jgi:DNA polymerase-3 subunit gamma/tau
MCPLQHDYRPDTLDKIVGNQDTVAALKAVLARKPEMQPHCFAFVGPKGCGKTTMARNSASYRGIDSAREMIAQSRLMPLRGSRKAWLMDEAHKLTGDAQEALLKIVEEPPAHVFLFFATTDPQKMKKTLLDRGHIFKVEALGRKQVEVLVTKVLTAEKVKLDEKVIQAVVDNCDGSARNALVLLDSVIDLPADQAVAVAKRVSDEQVEAIALCRALIKGEKWSNVAAIIKGMGEFDVESTRLAILGYCNAILLKEDNNRAWLVYDSFRDPLDRNGRSAITYQAYMAVQAK